MRRFFYTVCVLAFLYCMRRKIFNGVMYVFYVYVQFYYMCMCISNFY